MAILYSWGSRALLGGEGKKGAREDRTTEGRKERGKRGREKEKNRFALKANEALTSGARSHLHM